MNEPGARPEPQLDAEPDEGNAAGGVDAVEEAVELPPVGTDVPSAQLQDDLVPDEVLQPEEPDSEANLEDPSSEPAD